MERATEKSETNTYDVDGWRSKSVNSPVEDKEVDLP